LLLPRSIKIALVTIMSGIQGNLSSDDWTTVTKSNKKRIARRSRGRTSAPTATFVEKQELSVEGMTECQNKLLEELPQSAFFQNFLSKLAELPTTTTAAITNIVCFGVGNFGTQSAPQWQLACAMALWRTLKEKATDATISMEYYDPCTTQNETIFLERNGVKVLSVNTRGQRFVEEPTLFFMPHCPLSLYTNVFYTNWEWLDRLIIFGNSMSAYANRLVENKHVRLLQLLEPHWSEDLIAIAKSDVAERSGHFEQAFNDSSITCFTKGYNTATIPDKPNDFFNDGLEDTDETI
jgi:hypothetical protein